LGVLFFSVQQQQIAYIAVGVAVAGG